MNELAFDALKIDLNVIPDTAHRTRVAVWAPDQITMIGLIETLLGRHEAFVASIDQPTDVDALVLATDQVTTEFVRYLRRLAGSFTAPMVLVVNLLDRSCLRSLVECRVVSIVHRQDADEQRLASAVQFAAGRHDELPPQAPNHLIPELRSPEDEGRGPRGIAPVDLTSREIDMVRLLADGCDTEEIGNRLRYSERTVKYVIHAMTSRLKIRNRPQLVAYALRLGII